MSIPETKYNGSTALILFNIANLWAPSPTSKLKQVKIINYLYYTIFYLNQRILYLVYFNKDISNKFK